MRRSLMFLAVLAAASPVLAVNLVTNSNFNGSLAGWTVTGGGTVYDGTVDATGVPGSGSARDTALVSGTTTPVSQCIPAVPGTYTISGKVLVPNGSIGSAGFGVTWFAGSNCTGPILGSAGGGAGTSASFVSLSTPTTAPPGTTSALVNTQHIATPGNIAYFDDIILDAPASVPALGPLALIALMVMLAAVGVFRQLR